MTETRLCKPASLAAAANMPDYAAEVQRFAWEGAAALLDGLPGGRLNIAYEAVDRHVARGNGERLALRWIGKDQSRHDFTYERLAAETSRFASVLKGLGLARGDRVFALLGRVPELYVAALGTLKAGCVFSPLFSAFGPEPVRARMDIGEARVLAPAGSASPPETRGRCW